MRETAAHQCCYMAEAGSYSLEWQCTMKSTVKWKGVCSLRQLVRAGLNECNTATKAFQGCVQENIATNIANMFNNTTGHSLVTLRVSRVFCAAQATVVRHTRWLYRRLLRYSDLHQTQATVRPARPIVALGAHRLMLIPPT